MRVDVSTSRAATRDAAATVPSPARRRASAWRAGIGTGAAALAGRVAAGAALLVTVALLPWLSRSDPALTVLRTRSAEQNPTPGALAAVRDELGLDDGPFTLLGRWLGGLLRGDAGTSWVSGEPVLPDLVPALGVSLTLVAGALVVTVVVAALVSARTVFLGSHRRLHRARAGTGAAVLAALPKFLLASVLATVFGVWLGWFPTSGWVGPASMVLPALALGVPSGAMIGGLLDQALPAAFHEPWARTWYAVGFPPGHAVRHALRRTVPGVLPQLLPTVVALVGGAVSVEMIFNVPGVGRLVLGAALAQDLPVLQAGTLTLVLLGGAAGLGLRSLRRRMLGPALREGALPTLHRPPMPVPGALRYVAAACALALVTLCVAGLLRDPLHVDTAARLLPPSTAHPLGTDSLGRDLLARLGHGALRTTGVALAVTAVSVLVGVLLGMVPKVSAGLTEVVSTLPAVLAGLLVTGLTGPSVLGAALAVCVVGWSPYAAQTSALLQQERAAGHVTASVALGGGRVHVLRRHLLPSLVPPVLRNALLRLPTAVLVLASLGFLGLGAQAPSPEWGRLLSENQAYVELAPWTVLGPAAALVVLAVLAVAGAGIVQGGVRGRGRSGR
ncbi:ABC transporter permease subunit [Streptomyces candidus]|uniref:ABC-type dipeptide/oligopeptide/nickel transport system permease subunit/ABC-type dipeptide/oligopeptide/nickel transport system permease component n=1 Tax=Streptomyces candidus TaxID=67283 RepID=A0A7X0HL66_9ACTN|nr:ABC transporter permease subunit [Streptomyces candidus]MBB6438188.1 ABC-type dipeptide/oligopeptide/nickel transport system permease subunit/ABC-type dipeptide/oligopeptide/nickel transport system permease component [Streptomyces candidus]GHH38991.1 ABC transporter permease [Streptomyces candidus]